MWDNQYLWRSVTFQGHDTFLFVGARIILEAAIVCQPSSPYLAAKEASPVAFLLEDLGKKQYPSDACRSPIPIQADHRFRRMAITDSDMPIGDSDMPITDSDACRSLWSERVGALDNPL